MSPGQHSFPNSPGRHAPHGVAFPHFLTTASPFWQSPLSCQGAEPASSLLTPDHVLTPTSSFLGDLKTSTSTPPTAKKTDEGFPQHSGM